MFVHDNDCKVVEVEDSGQRTQGRTRLVTAFLLAGEQIFRFLLKKLWRFPAGRGGLEAESANISGAGVTAHHLSFGGHGVGRARYMAALQSGEDSWLWHLRQKKN